MFGMTRTANAAAAIVPSDDSEATVCGILQLGNNSYSLHCESVSLRVDLPQRILNSLLKWGGERHAGYSLYWNFYFSRNITVPLKQWFARLRKDSVDPVVKSKLLTLAKGVTTASLQHDFGPYAALLSHNAGMTRSVVNSFVEICGGCVPSSLERNLLGNLGLALKEEYTLSECMDLAGVEHHNDASIILPMFSADHATYVVVQKIDGYRVWICNGGIHSELFHKALFEESDRRSNHSMGHCLYVGVPYNLIVEFVAIIQKYKDKACIFNKVSEYLTKHWKRFKENARRLSKGDDLICEGREVTMGRQLIGNCAVFNLVYALRTVSGTFPLTKESVPCSLDRARTNEIVTALEAKLNQVTSLDGGQLEILRAMCVEAKKACV